MKWFNIFFIACGIFTVICVGYEVLNVPITFNIDKEYTGFMIENETGKDVTIKMTGKLKKRLISVDEFDGVIEIEEDVYDCWMKEGSYETLLFNVHDGDRLGGMVQTVNPSIRNLRKYLF